MVTLIKRISLSELSEKALDETLNKYSRALRGRSLSWTWCRICGEIENDEDTRCKTLCPLYPSEWCRNDRRQSRLYDTYVAMNEGEFREKEYERWKNDVNNYLWWITTELEIRRAKCERKWGGAW